MGIMFGDLRYAWRSLLHHPSFAIVAIVSIALGIGANSVMFSLADALLFRPLPIPDANRVVNVRSQLHGEPPAGMSFPDFTDVQSRSKSFDGVTALQLGQFGYAPDKRTLPEMKAGFAVRGNFFNVMHITPALGRTFRPEEDTVPGRDAVTVLSYDTWRNEFSSSPNVIGRSLFLNGIEFKVIGVAPESFTGMDQYFRPTLYIPLMMSSRLAGDPTNKWMQDRQDRRLTVKARLADGVNAKAADAEVRVIAAALAKEYPATNKDWAGTVRTEIQARIDLSPYDALLVVMLLGLAGVVLVIACANVANLMLGRALARSREIAIRMAIGAGRGRLVRQLLTESLLISLMAGALGLLFAQSVMDLFLPWRIPSEIPIEINAQLDMRVMFYAFCAAVASAVICGLVPAFRATKSDIGTSLRAGGRNADGRGRLFAGRNLLVVAQVAGSLFLLVCATQLYRGISLALSAPPGFRIDHVLMASFDPTLARYSESQTQDFYKRLTDRARQMPGVVSAAVTEIVPMSNHPHHQLILPEGYHPPPGKEALAILTDVVSEEYFNTLDIPIVKGRGFETSDTADSRRVAVVNERFAKTYFPGKDAIGKRFRLGGPTGTWIEVVGVAKPSKYAMLVEPPMDFVYLPFSQNHRTGMTLLLRSAGAPDSLAGPLREVVRSLDSDQPVFAMRTMEQYFHDRATRVYTILTSLIAGMGVVGLILALSGLYAVMAWSVARRSREIGIRMAVGADRVRVLAMVLSQGVRISLIGIGIGLALSIAFSKALTVGIGVPSFNMPIVAAVSAALLAMALAGAYVPARKASLVDPITVLKEE